MSEVTKIAWCDSTFNPWIGCSKVGPGCDHCYAEAQDSRMRWEGKKHWGAGVPRYRTSISNWAQPLKWNKAAEKSGKVHRVFCASLADVFDNEVPDEWRVDLWMLINATPHLSWLLVTKRVGNVARMVSSIDWLAIHDNVRILITVCNQEEADRDIPKLLALPCNNGLSIEPQLGLIDLRAIVMPDGDSLGVALFSDGEDRGIEWVISGGESGTKARPLNLAWPRKTVTQCRAAGVPVFVKQLGARPWFGTTRDGEPHIIMVDCKDRAGADMDEWPDDLRVREFP